MLTIHGLSAGYGESQILWDVDLHVPAGQVVCLMGRNGVGKTTLLKSIMGLLKSWSGSVSFQGNDLNPLSPGVRASCGIGYVPQGREIFPHLTVQENLRIGLVAQKKRNGAIPEEIFQMFPVLQTMLTRQGGVLSGGQQQQLAFARALVTQPRLLLLDEPTEGIQPSLILEIEEVIRQLKARGTVAILLVEQYLEFAWRLADLYYVMEKGRIVVQGSTRDLTTAAVKKHLTL
jgi:urea transport system ATP-binding protein